MDSRLLNAIAVLDPRTARDLLRKHDLPAGNNDDVVDELVGAVETGIIDEDDIWDANSPFTTGS